MPSEMAMQAVRCWVVLYTTGLAQDVRSARRAEMDSDVWEHYTDANSAGESALTTARAILGRALRGVLADVFWRFNLKGEPKMVSKSFATRTAGLVMLAMVGLLAAMSSTDYGISGDEPYFTEDFPDFAANVGSYIFTLTFGAGMALMCGIGAVALLQAFRPYQVWLAVIGSAALLTAAVLLVASVTAGIALVDLAEEWTSSGSVTGDGVWVSARHLAQTHEDTGFLALTAIVVSLATFALLVIWKAPVPRWVGSLGILSGALIVGSVPAWAVNDTLGWLTFVGSTLAGVLWLVVTGAWLLLKGTYQRTLPAASAATPS